MSSIEIEVLKHQLINLYKSNSPMKLRFLMLRSQEELRLIKDAITIYAYLDSKLKEAIINDISSFLVFPQVRVK